MNTKTLFKSCIAAVVLTFSSITLAGESMDNQQLAEQLNQNWDSVFNKGDVAALTQLYGEQAVISPGNGNTLKGHQAINELFKGFIDGGVHSHKIEVIETQRDGNVLYQVSKWQASGQAQDGVTPTFGGVVTLVSKLNEAGEWKLQVHSWNMGE
jgi:uncharacterized protein (TIGR02246 family)